MYQDYELTSYPQQVMDNIPVPPGAQLIEQRDYPDRTCRSMGIVRYYITDLSWEQVMTLYKPYLEASPWKAYNPNESYIWIQSPANQKLDLIFHHITNPQDDLEKQLINSGKTAYLVQISYGQDNTAWKKYCKPED
jgi:hypothetical protein